MLIPPSYLIRENTQEDRRARARRIEREFWAAHAPERSGYVWHGLDRGLVTLVAVMVGIVGYGGLMELVL